VPCTPRRPANVSLVAAAAAEVAAVAAEVAVAAEAEAEVEVEVEAGKAAEAAISNAVVRRSDMGVGIRASGASGRSEGPMKSGIVSGFEYVLDAPLGGECLLCRATDRPLLMRKGDLSAIGLCETCTGTAGWAWRQLVGEAPPLISAETIAQIKTVYVLIASRKQVPRADASESVPEAERWIKAPVELTSSYQFLCIPRLDGSVSSFDLPNAQVPSVMKRHPIGMNPRVVEGALDALEAVGLVSWAPVLEILYVGYGPRGRLVAVVLARGWAFADAMRPSHSWISWPLADHTGSMSGFYRSLETVLDLRLYKHCSIGEPEDLCVRMREAARRYVELQAQIRAKKETDPSMIVAYQAAMNADERLIELTIKIGEERARGGVALALVSHPSAPARRSKGKPKTKATAKFGPSPFSDRSVEDPPSSVSDDEGFEEFIEDGSEDGAIDGEPIDGEPDDDPTFVRPPRPLTQE
jgi:hypothetical protein